MYYVAHRLFALHDRVLGARAARVLAEQVGESEVFLPFCDTDEEALTVPQKGRLLFELDTERLRTLDGLLAILHGPSLDDGVCMEIGFAHRLGVPVVVLTTDFQTFSLTHPGAAFTFPDPLIEAIVDSVVAVPAMEPAGARTSDRFGAFEQRNEVAVTRALRGAVEELLRCQGDRQPEQAARSKDRRVRRCLVEPSPYWPDPEAAQLAGALRRQGMEVAFSERLSGNATASRLELVISAHADWARMCRSDLLVVNVEGPETPPGAAVLIGAALAQSTRVFAQLRSDRVTHAPGREANYRNLMIQYSVTERFGKSSDIGEMIG